LPILHKRVKSRKRVIIVQHCIELIMKNWIVKMENWCLHWATTRWSRVALFLCAFADASFLPLPTPLFFLTLSLLNISKAYRYALVTVAGTITGAVAGYSIGHFAWINSGGEFTRLAHFLFDNVPGFSVETYENIRLQYAKWDFWILFVASLMPVPYKIFSISAGVFDINLFMVLIATMISQGVKYYLLALMAIKIGPKVKELIRHRYVKVALITAGSIAVTLILIKVL
jgi:membrane protein YqaA with SNARE-associated domain